MKVAVTMRAARDPATGEVRDAIARDVIAWVEGLGAVPALVPNSLREPAAFVVAHGADALVLTGGNDAGSDAARDGTEAALLRHACERSLPVFGMCRGMQMIVRFFGGAIERIEPAKGHVGVHEIVLREAMPLCAGVTAARVMTNSFHDFGMREAALPRELEALAVSHDGFVEAIRHRSLPIVAVQWHPERAGSCTAVDAALAQQWLSWCDRRSLAGARA